MAKLGRYSADRKKVDALTAASSLEVADCGTLFTLGTAAGFATVLPAISAAGKGWWCKFIVIVSPTGGAGYTIDLSGSDAVTGVITTGADGAATDSAGAAQAVFVNDAAIIGDQLECVTDGVRWYFTGHCNAATGIDME